MSSLSISIDPVAKVIHRIFHEIEERTDTDVDKVATIIEIWEELKGKRLTNGNPHSHS